MRNDRYNIPSVEVERLPAVGLGLGLGLRNERKKLSSCIIFTIDYLDTK